MGSLPLAFLVGSAPGIEPKASPEEDQANWSGFALLIAPRMLVMLLSLVVGGLLCSTRTRAHNSHIVLRLHHVTITDWCAVKIVRMMWGANTAQVLQSTLLTLSRFFPASGGMLEGMVASNKHGG